MVDEPDLEWDEDRGGSRNARAYVSTPADGKFYEATKNALEWTDAGGHDTDRKRVAVAEIEMIMRKSRVEDPESLVEHNFQEKGLALDEFLRPALQLLVTEGFITREDDEGDENVYVYEDRHEMMLKADELVEQLGDHDELTVKKESFDWYEGHEDTIDAPELRWFASLNLKQLTEVTGTLEIYSELVLLTGPRYAAGGGQQHPWDNPKGLEPAQEAATQATHAIMLRYKEHMRSTPLIEMTMPHTPRYTEDAYCRLVGHLLGAEPDFDLDRAVTTAYWILQRDVVPPTAVLDDSGRYYWVGSQRWRSRAQERTMFARRISDAVQLAGLQRAVRRHLAKCRAWRAALAQQRAARHFIASRRPRLLPLPIGGRPGVVFEEKGLRVVDDDLVPSEVWDSPRAALGYEGEGPSALDTGHDLNETAHVCIENALVEAAARHKTSIHLGLAADSVSQPDYDMASAAEWPIEHVSDEVTTISVAHRRGQSIGLGLFAARDIGEGERVAVFGEGALMWYRDWPEYCVPRGIPQDWGGFLASRGMPAPQKRFTTAVLYDKSWRDNVSGRRPKWSYMNHSRMRPNCHAQVPDASSNQVSWTTMRAVAAGEELTFTYFGDTSDYIEEEETGAPRGARNRHSATR